MRLQTFVHTSPDTDAGLIAIFEYWRTLLYQRDIVSKLVIHFNQVHRSRLTAGERQIGRLHTISQMCGPTTNVPVGEEGKRTVLHVK